MGQHLVDVVQQSEPGGRGLQALQPDRVPAHPQEVGGVEGHQVAAVVPCCRLARGENPVRGEGGVSTATH